MYELLADIQGGIIIRTYFYHW